MKVKVYVEGGGDGRELRARCRRGFSSFFGKAKLAGRMPQVIVCGGRQSAYEKFRRALGLSDGREFIVLLVDSEGPVAKGSGPWSHLEAIDGWAKPEDATDRNAHLMVQCMEAWFLADRSCLATFFGQGFDPNALPGNRNLEEVSKTDVLRGLKSATRQCRSKGEYDKGRHSFDLLSEIDPASVMDASPRANRLVATLRKKAS